MMASPAAVLSEQLLPVYRVLPTIAQGDYAHFAATAMIAAAAFLHLFYEISGRRTCVA
jgi:hypothetical protein